LPLSIAYNGVVVLNTVLKLALNADVLVKYLSLSLSCIQLIGKSFGDSKITCEKLNADKSLFKVYTSNCYLNAL